MTKMKKDFLPILLLTAFLLIFFFPVLFLGRTYVTTGVVMSDLANQNYPFKVVYAQALKEGYFPFWVKNMGNGFPLVAEGQVGAFYPLNMLFFYLLPTLLAFNLSLFFHYFLAGLFIYLLARSWLKFESWSALMAGLTFALSGFMVIHLVHLSMIQTVAWFPLQLLLLQKMLRKARLWQGLVLGLVFGVQFLAGHPELFFFSALFLGAYLAFQLFTSSKEIAKNWLILGLSLFLGVVVAVVLALPQLLSSWQMIGFSNRARGMSFEEATSYLFPLKHFLTWVVPWFFDFVRESTPPAGGADMTNIWETYLYLGLVPFGLAFWGAVKTFKKETKSRLLIGMAVFALVLSLGRSTPVFKFFWHLVPGIKLFKYPTRFLVFSAFSISLLAGWGVEIIRLKIKNQKLKIIFATSVVLITFFDLWLTQGKINPTMKASEWLTPPPTVQFLKESLNGYRFYTIGTANVDYASIKDRLVQKDLRGLLPGDFNLLYSLASANEQAAFFLDRHTLLTKSTPGARLSFNAGGTFQVSDQLVKTLSLRAVRYVLSPLPLVHDDLVEVKRFALENSTDYLVPQLVGERIEITRVPVEKIIVYENMKVLPRARMVYQTRVCPDCSESRLLEILAGSEFEPEKEVLLEKDPGLGLDLNGRGRVEILQNDDLMVTLKVVSQGDGWLVLADNDYPAWQATVDGQPVEILTSNFAYRGVAVPDGEHEVVFKYMPAFLRKAGP